MIPAITKLIIKVEQLEWDLAEIKAELVKLQASAMKSLTPEERKAVRLARVRAQNERLRPSIEKALGKPDPAAETLTAEELQQLLLEEGIKPEDNIGSRAIIEERERLLCLNCFGTGILVRVELQNSLIFLGGIFLT